MEIHRWFERKLRTVAVVTIRRLHENPFPVHREFPGKFEVTNLSLEILSREIGRNPCWSR